MALLEDVTERLSSSCISLKEIVAESGEGARNFERLLALLGFERKEVMMPSLDKRVTKGFIGATYVFKRRNLSNLSC